MKQYDDLSIGQMFYTDNLAEERYPDLEGVPGSLTGVLREAFAEGVASQLPDPEYSSGLMDAWDSEPYDYDWGTYESEREAYRDQEVYRAKEWQVGEPRFVVMRRDHPDSRWVIDRNPWLG